MKNTLLIIFTIVLLASSCGKNNDFKIPIEGEEQIEKIYEGNITLGSQTEVEAFGAEHYTKIKFGTLTIVSSDLSDPVIDISSLRGLRQVDGNVDIINTDLTSLQGLDSLDYVNGKVLIEENRLLQHLAGLEKLREVAFHFLVYSNNSLTSVGHLVGLERVSGAFSIYNNPELEVINGLNNLSQVDGNHGCSISSNLKLTTIRGFNGLTYGGVGISGNPLLTKVDGFQQANNFGVSLDFNESLVTLDGFDSFTNGGLFIKDNPQLTSFPAFSRLTAIEGLWMEDNNQLESLQDFESLVSIEHVFIKNNNKLTDYCALSIALSNLSDDEFTLILNEYNPTLEDFLNGDCSN